MRSLIVNADDFGFTAAINRGITEAFEAGVVRSVSMMTGQPGWRDAVHRASAAGPELDIGLHFNLSVGAPVTRAPSLTDRRTGAFLPVKALVARALAGRVRPEEAEAECRAQAEQLHDAGVAISHFDGHLHLHLLPGIWTGVVATARALGRLPVRVPHERGWPRRGASPAGSLKQALLGAASAGALRKTPPPVAPLSFAGATLQGDDRYLSRLHAVIRTLPAGTSELMTHPGYVDGPLPGGDTYDVPREAELRALTSSQLRDWLDAAEVTLTSFRALTAQQHAHARSSAYAR
ncbi:MAG: ChbG/HpnK family deacetylase [Actinobacteria bacterium]|nr:ChbG/HpnK family deacetylase [Actinomycetota bacterium]